MVAVSCRVGNLSSRDQCSGNQIRDSGAILVGTGNPPADTHGRKADPITGEVYVDRARFRFSNYGTQKKLKIEWHNIDIASFDNPYSGDTDQCVAVLESLASRAIKRERGRISL